MTAVSKMTPHIKDIKAPSELRNLPAWLIWRYEHDDKLDKPRKMPYYTNGGIRHGVQGRTEDRNQLTTFDAAKSAAARRGYDGVGFALMPEFGLVALDFDDCVTDQGLDATVENLVAGTYAEYSPSGNGVRAFMKGNLGNRKSHGKPFGFEVFSDKGFVTFTGNTLEVTEMMGATDTIADLSDEVIHYYQERFREAFEPDVDVVTDPPIGLTDGQIQDALDVLDPDMGHDDWLHVGMALHHETNGQGFEYWNTWSQASEKYPGRDALQRRWNSFGKNNSRRVTAKTLVRMASRNGAYLGTFVSMDEFEAIVDSVETIDAASVELPTKAANDLRFEPIPCQQFSQGTPPAWIVKGIVPQAELLVLFGESGSGKSFLALDLAFSIALGTEWRGHKVKQGRVVYIAAEGGGGVRKRLTAYALHHDIDLADVPMGIIHASPNLLSKDDALDIAKAIRATGGAQVVIVDTFAQTMPGANENAGEDVGKALAHCKGIHIATGALVILVHHAGKDTSKGARGWSGLRAAADAEIEVIRNQQSERYARISKQKDGEDGLEFGFKLEMIDVGMDEDGDIVQSCVAIEAEVPEDRGRGRGAQGRRKPGKNEQLALDVAVQLLPTNGDGLELDYLVGEIAERMERGDGKRDIRKQSARRALLKVMESDHAPFAQDGDHIRILV